MTSQPGSREAAGFSLVELVLVVVIIGIVSAIALPRFAQATARQQLEAAANRVASDLDLARVRALAASRAVTLTFDLDNNSYQFNAVGGEATTVQLAESPYDVTITQADFSGSAIAKINGYGVPVSSGYVTLQSTSGTVTITLNNNGKATQ